MLDEEQLDKEGHSGFLLSHERELLKHEAETVRTFYSLTGPARKEYAIQMAEADAERIRITRQAEADGILAIRKAEAEGFKLVGDALASIPNADQVIQLATLRALQKVADSLADGKATKLFLPQSLGDIFSAIGGWQEIVKGEGKAPGAASIQDGSS